MLDLSNAVSWMKKNPLLTLAIVLAVWWLWNKLVSGPRVIVIPSGTAEKFSTCLQSKQIYLNSCDETEPTNHADVFLEKRFGKFYITIKANLPYAEGGVFHTVYGAYYCFLVSSTDNESINIGTMVRHGDRWYKLSTELLGQYDKFDRIDVYRQTEDYEPKRVLTGSINKQGCSSL